MKQAVVYAVEQADGTFKDHHPLKVDESVDFDGFVESLRSIKEVRAIPGLEGGYVVVSVTATYDPEVRTARARVRKVRDQFDERIATLRPGETLIGTAPLARARALKYAAEGQLRGYIADVVRDFQEATGLTVSAIDIGLTQHQPIGAAGPTVMVATVNLDVRLS